ncbi:hypothetical protein AMTRI_Chr02g263240 [Amborella trichopoda]
MDRKINNDEINKMVSKVFGGGMSKKSRSIYNFPLAKMQSWLQFVFVLHILSSSLSMSKGKKFHKTEGIGVTVQAAHDVAVVCDSMIPVKHRRNQKMGMH